MKYAITAEHKKGQLTTQQLSCHYFESNQDIVTAQACVDANLSNTQSVCETIPSVLHAVVAAARLGMFNAQSKKCAGKVGFALFQHALNSQID